MRRACWLVLLCSCRCGSIETTVLTEPGVSEAGPTVDLPGSVQAPLPKLDQLIADEASVERNVLKLKGLGLGALIDAGPTP